MNVGRYTVDLHMLSSELAEQGKKKESTMLLEVASRLVRLENLAQVVDQEHEKIKELVDE